MAIGEDLDLALRIRALVEGQDAIVNLGTSFVDLNQRVETLMRGLTSIAGSAEGASKEFDYLQDVADKYGLKLLDLADSYLKLNAASKGTNLEGEATKKIFESVSGAMAVLGGTTESTERAFTALTQMMSKGQIYSEELKGQLAESIPGAIQTMSRALGIGTQDLLKMMEAGNITSDVLLPFAYELDSQYGKLAVSSDTFSQAINRLKNSWLEVMKGIGDTGAWQLLTQAIGAVADNSKAMAVIVETGITVALAKMAQAMISTTAETYNSIKAAIAHQVAMKASATQAAYVAQAEAVLASASLNRAKAEFQAATNAVRMAEANMASARTASAYALAQAQLQAAQERLAAATIAGSAAQAKFTATAAASTAAQKAMAAAASVWSRAWSFLMGPGGLILTGVAALAYFVTTAEKATTSTDALASTTEDYVDSLQKMTDAQKAAEQAKLTNALEDQKEKVSDLKGEVDDLVKMLEGDYLSVTGFLAAFDSVEEVQNNLAVARGNLEIATQELNATEEKMAVAFGQSSAAQNESIDKTKASSDAIKTKIQSILTLNAAIKTSESALKESVVQSESEIAAIRQSSDLYLLRAKQSKDYVEQLKAESNSVEASIEIAEREMAIQAERLSVESNRLELMKAKSEASSVNNNKLVEEIQNQELVVEKLKSEVQQRQSVIDKTSLQAAETKGISDVIIESLGAQQASERGLRIERELTLEQVQKYQQALLATNEANKAGLVTTSDVTRVQASYNTALNQYSEQQASAVSALEARNKQEEAGLSVKIESLRVQSEQAKAQGDEQASLLLATQAKAEEIALSERMVEMRQEEKQALQTSLDAKQLLVESDRTLLLSEADQLSAIKNNINAKEIEIATEKNHVEALKATESQLSLNVQTMAELTTVQENQEQLLSRQLDRIRDYSDGIEELSKLEREVANARIASNAASVVFQTGINDSDEAVAAYRETVRGYKTVIEESDAALKAKTLSLVEERSALQDLNESLQTQLAVEQSIIAQLEAKKASGLSLNNTEQQRLELAKQSVVTLEEQVVANEQILRQKDLEIERNNLLLKSNTALAESYRILGVTAPEAVVSASAQAKAAFAELEYQQANSLEKIGLAFDGLSEKVGSAYDGTKSFVNYLVSAQPWIESLKEAFSGENIAVDQARQAFMEYAKAALLAAKATGDIVDPAVKLKAEQLGLSVAFDELQRSVQAVSLEFDALEARYDRQIAKQKAIATTTSSGIDALLAEANARRALSDLIGDYDASLNASFAAQARQLELARQSATTSRDEANAAIEHVRAIERRVEAGEKLSSKQKEELEQSRQDAIQKSDAAAKSAALSLQLEAEAASYESVKSKIAAAGSARLEEINRTIESTKIVASEIQARQKVIDAISELNVVRNEEAERAKLTLASIQEGITLANEEATAKRLQLSAAIDYLNKLKEESTGLEALNPIRVQEIRNSELVVEQLKKEVGLANALALAKQAEKIAIEEAAKAAGLSVEKYLSLEKTFKLLGLDVREVFTGMDVEFAKMIVKLEEVGMTGELTGKHLKEAINKAINSADTVEELTALQNKLIELYNAKKLSDAEFSQSLADLQVKMAEVRGQIDPLATAMKALGVGVPEQLNAVALQLQTNYESVKALGGGTAQLKDGFLKAAEAMLDAEAAGIKIDNSWLNQRAASLDLSEALNKLREARQRDNQEVDAIIEKYSKAQPLLEKQLELITKEIDRKIESNDTDVLRNTVLGKSLDVAKDLINQSELTITQAKAEVIEKEKLLENDKAKIAELNKQKDSTAGLSTEQQRNLDLLKASLPIQEEDIAKSKEAAKQAELTAFSYGTVSTAIDTLNNAASAEYTLQDKVIDSKKNHLEQEEKLAKAKGDTTTAIRLENEQLDLSVKQAKNDAEAKQAAAVAANEYLNGLIALAQQDGEVTAAEQAGITVATQLVEVKNQEAASAKDVATAIANETEEKKKNTAATQDNNDAIKQADASFKTTAEDLNNLNVGFAKFRDQSAVAFSTEGIADYNAIIKDIQESIDAANTAADNLSKYGMAAATAETQGLADALENSESYLNDAADAAGQNLRQALADAKEEAESLREELSGIATDFSEKILDLTGDELTQLYVDRAQDLTDAQEKYAAAGALATKEYTDAKNAIEAYYNLAIAKQKEADAADSTGKMTSNMNALTAATQSATKAAESLAKTNLSGIINQTSTLATNVQTLGSYF